LAALRLKMFPTRTKTYERSCRRAAASQHSLALMERRGGSLSFPADRWLHAKPRGGSADQLGSLATRIVVAFFSSGTSQMNADIIQ